MKTRIALFVAFFVFTGAAFAQITPFIQHERDIRISQLHKQLANERVAMAMPVVTDACMSMYKMPILPQTPTARASNVCGGSNGVFVRLSTTLTPDTDLSTVQVTAYIDSDRDPSTGRKPSTYGYDGPLASDSLVGVDYKLSLYGVDNMARLENVYGVSAGDFPVSMDGLVLNIDIPATLIDGHSLVGAAVNIGDRYGLVQKFPAIDIAPVNIKFWPRNLKVDYRQAWDFAMVVGFNTGVIPYRVDAYLDGLPYDLSVLQKESLFPPTAFYVGKNFPTTFKNRSTGTHTFMVVIYTNRGMYIDQAMFNLELAATTNLLQ